MRREKERQRQLGGKRTATFFSHPVYEMGQEHFLSPLRKKRQSHSGRVSNTIKSRSTFSLPFLRNKML